MKVLQVVPRLESGGVERGTLEVAEALVKSGHGALVVSQGGPMVQELKGIGALHTVMRVGEKSPRSLLAVGDLQRLIRSENVDIVHPRSRLPAWLCWLAIRKLEHPPKLVTSVHGFHSISKYSEVVTRGARVEVVSQSVRKYVLENYEIDEDRIRTIYRGIDPSIYDPKYSPSVEWLKKWKTEFPDSGNAVTLLLAGRLTRLKGHHTYFDVVKELVGRNIDVLALIVGDAEKKRRGYEIEIRDRVMNDQILKGHVRFLGRRQDLREVMKMTDIVMSLSTTPESFGRTALEALSLGVPVVGFDHGGVGEILEVMFPQGAVPLGNVGGVCCAVENILQGKVTKIARQHPFLLAQMRQQTLAMYEELVT